MGLGFFYYSWLYCFHVQRFERANDGIVQNIRKYFWLCFFSSLSLVCLCTIYNGIHILGWSGITFSGCELKYGENELKNLSFCLCVSFALSFTLCECERVFAISMRKIGTFRVYRYHGNSNYPHRLRHRNKFSHAHQNFLISFASFAGVRALFVLAKASFCVFRVFVLSCS